MDKRAVTLAAMCLAVLMVQLDTTVVNLALRPIQTNLHTDVSTLQWVIDGYNLVYATFILTGAILGDRFGRKRMFLVGVVLFALGSVVSAVSPSALVLVLSRVITGFGAAIALPISLSIVSAMYADEKARNRAIAIWAGINGVAIAIGPSAGGALVDHFGWRSIFVMFVPVAVAAFALTAAIVAESRSTEARSLDVTGQILAVVTLLTFTFAFIEGPRLHWDLWIVEALLASVLSFAGFLAVERKVRSPLIDLAIFGNPTFSGAMFVTLSMTFGMYAFLFIVPNYFQSVVGLSALETGVLILPLGVLFAVLSPFVGRWIPKLGSRRLIVTGMAFQVAGLLTAVGLGAHGPIWLALLATSLLGLALGFETAPLMSAAMAAVPKDRFGMPSGIVNVFRISGATLGVAILGSVLAGHVGGGTPDPGAFVRGMHVAMLAGAGVAAFALVVALVLIDRSSATPAVGQPRFSQAAPGTMAN